MGLLVDRVMGVCKVPKREDGSLSSHIHRYLISLSLGLEVMLTRLSAVTDLVRGRHLLLTLLKLFSYCVKIGVNRKALLQPHLNAISIMLASLNMVSHGRRSFHR